MSGNGSAASLKRGGRTATLTLAALGVVFGDIGTSPLYALKSDSAGHHPIHTQRDVLGVLSLILGMIILVSIKYVSSSCAPTTRAKAAGWP